MRRRRKSEPHLLESENSSRWSVFVSSSHPFPPSLHGTLDMVRYYYQVASTTSAGSTPTPRQQTGEDDGRNKRTFVTCHLRCDRRNTIALIKLKAARDDSDKSSHQQRANKGQVTVRWSNNLITRNAEKGREGKGRARSVQVTEM